jgi:hypothetical protein
VSERIDAHHELELELFRLRLLRDLGRPEYRPEAEDLVLDRLEALWLTFSDVEREVLEAERRARFDDSLLISRPTQGRILVDVERHPERSLPPRLSIDAA